MLIYRGKQNAWMVPPTYIYVEVLFHHLQYPIILLRFPAQYVATNGMPSAKVWQINSKSSRGIVEKSAAMYTPSDYKTKENRILTKKNISFIK